MEAILICAAIGVASGATLGYSKNLYAAMLVFAACCVIGFYLLVGPPSPTVGPQELVAQFGDRAGIAGLLAVVVAAVASHYFADRSGAHA